MWIHVLSKLLDYLLSLGFLSDLVISSYHFLWYLECCTQHLSVEVSYTWLLSGTLVRLPRHFKRISIDRIRQYNYLWTWCESKVAQSCLTLCDPMDCSSSGSWNSPGKNTGVGCHFLPQGIFPIQGSNPCLPSCRQILDRLNHQGSPRDLKGYAVSTLPALSQWNSKSLDDSTSVDSMVCWLL